MSVALIEPFNRWFLSPSTGSGTTRRNDCYTKCGGFDKLLKLLATDGMLVKRPILITDTRILVGFRENEWLDAIK